MKAPANYIRITLLVYPSAYGLLQHINCISFGEILIVGSNMGNLKWRGTARIQNKQGSFYRHRKKLHQIFIDQVRKMFLQGGDAIV